MHFSSLLFNQVIVPIRTLLEIIFMAFYNLTASPGISVILLSLAMNVLLLPLYNRTDAIQNSVLQKEKSMRQEISHIKKNFKGSEQFMMLQTCYRQHHYKPLDAVKGLLPLMLEVPFFIAAYKYLLGLDILNGAAFGKIENLNAPDEILLVGMTLVNLLPILMTLINLLSAMLYTEGAPVKIKIQLYAMAMIFFVLLYNSPSSLVIYWTINNTFSLIKTIILRQKNPGKVTNMVLALSGIGLIPLIILYPGIQSHKLSLAVFSCVLLQLPWMISLIKVRIEKYITLRNSKENGIVFWSGCFCLAILMGLLIPSTIIGSSPAEFVERDLVTPLINIQYTMVIYAGFWVIWFSVFYLLSGAWGKNFMSCAVWILFCGCIVNYMFFGGDYGTLSPNLKYMDLPEFHGMWLNGILLAAIIAGAFFLWYRKPQAVFLLCVTMGLTMVGMSVFNMTGIQKEYKNTAAIMQSGTQNREEHVIPLSKHGKNVVILMLDRAISSYIPYIMQEKPEVRNQFEGFTYYPNTVSFGPCTNIGTPALFAGYEYTPEMMNRRVDERLVDKHNEALKVMPVLFSQNGFEVTVGDPSYAGYSWISDLSIYNAYPEINAFHSYDFIEDNYNLLYQKSLRARQFLFYSLFRTSPVVMQPYIYNGGDYHYVDHSFSTKGSASLGQKCLDIYQAEGISTTFTRAFRALSNLPNMVNVKDDDRNTFIMMTNDTTHEPCLLQEPEYVPAQKVDNREYEKENGVRSDADGNKLLMIEEDHHTHYQVNMAAMIQLGKWFDYLRENDLYDNTRIILVSDHGNALRQNPRLIWGEETYNDGMTLNCLLMVKDFDSHVFSADNTFMTNADVPTIATQGLIEKPLNPFSGNPINSDGKKQPVKMLFSNWRVTINNGNTFKKGEWVSVHDDITVKENWKNITEEMNRK